MGEAANTYATVNSNRLGNIGYSIERLIITESNGVPNPHIGQAHIVPTIHERQLQIFAASDAMFYLAGGIGTVEELSLDLVLKQRGSPLAAGKPSIVIDINGQYWPQCKDMAGVTYINLDVPTFEQLLDEAKKSDPHNNLEEHNTIASTHLKIIIRNLLLPLVKTLNIL